MKNNVIGESLRLVAAAGIAAGAYFTVAESIGDDNDDNIVVCPENLREGGCFGNLNGIVCSPNTVLDSNTGRTFDIYDGAFEQLAEGRVYLVRVRAQNSIIEVLGSGDTCEQ